MIKKQLIGLSEDEEISPEMLNGAWAPTHGYTMIGYKRLCNIESLVIEILKNNIDGHLIETGVWRGGATIYMKHLLNKFNSDKKVFVADSFCGLPAPNEEKYPADKGDSHHMVTFLAVSEEEVKSNFENFNLLDDKVIFLKGWFKDTLPLLNETFSIIRLDGDMYESTMDALENLYHKLSVGGYVIIDDYNIVAGCQIAVKDFREKYKINDEIIPIDGSAVYWKKGR